MLFLPGWRQWASLLTLAAVAAKLRQGAAQNARGLTEGSQESKSRSETLSIYYNKFHYLGDLGAGKKD